MKLTWILAKSVTSCSRQRKEWLGPWLRVTSRLQPPNRKLPQSNLRLPHTQSEPARQTRITKQDRHCRTRLRSRSMFRLLIRRSRIQAIPTLNWPAQLWQAARPANHFLPRALNIRSPEPPRNSMIDCNKSSIESKLTRHSAPSKPAPRRKPGSNWPSIHLSWAL